jgi:hypothetical protein
MLTERERLSVLVFHHSTRVEVFRYREEFTFSLSLKIYLMGVKFAFGLLLVNTMEFD